LGKKDHKYFSQKYVFVSEANQQMKPDLQKSLNCLIKNLGTQGSAIGAKDFGANSLIKTHKPSNCDADLLKKQIRLPSLAL
jgi:hypothetical protein